MNTLFDKIWDAHVVTSVAGGPDQLYIDRHYWRCQYHSYFAGTYPKSDGAESPVGRGV